MAEDLPTRLDELKDASMALLSALRQYQRALINARDAEGTWYQIAAMANTPGATARSRHRAATAGGEIHLRFDEVKPS
jgi:rhamnogalacturonyl hydrolase YesR